MALRLLIHAPTAAALARARSNARNLLRADPTAEVEIVVNAGAVATAIETGEVEPPLLLCGNSLAAQGLAAPETARVVPAAVLHIASRQNEGWAYMRA